MQNVEKEMRLVSAEARQYMCEEALIFTKKTSRVLAVVYPFPPILKLSDLNISSFITEQHHQFSIMSNFRIFIYQNMPFAIQHEHLTSSSFILSFVLSFAEIENPATKKWKKKESFFSILQFEGDDASYIGSHSITQKSVCGGHSVLLAVGFETVKRLCVDYARDVSKRGPEYLA